MKIFLIVLIIIHSLIHSLGFVKAFDLAKVSELNQQITKLEGMLWLLVTMLFILVAVLLVLKKDWWWMTGLVAVILSQVLITMSWSDAKFGTIPNIIILLAIIVSIGGFFIEREFRQNVVRNFENNNALSTEILSEADIAHLPAPVQKYIRYTGSVGRVKVKNFKAEFNGGIRFKRDEKYMSFSSTQYNFMDMPSRLFYIVAKKQGIPAIGLHLYQNEKAIFRIKLLGFFTVVDAAGRKMDQGETVTLLNDMCFMAPAALIDKRIKWESIDDLTVKAVYTNGNISISAMLFFNEKGELINFISNDRFETDGKVYKNYPWSTPASAYTNVNGYKLPSAAKLVYSRPDGEFTYGEFVLKDIIYNLEKM